MSSDTPMFSVVIPTCGDETVLERCLARLTASIQGLDEREFEVVVSNDGTSPISESFRMRYSRVNFVQGPRKGPAANRNCGARVATGVWLVFADDDCVPDPQWLWAYKVAINTHNGYRVFEGRIYTEAKRSRLDEFAPTNETGGFLWSCNFTIRRELFESLGGFDERFKYPAMEDVELRYRLKQSGEEFLFIRAAAVFHPLRRRKGRIELRQREEATLTYLEIHPEERKSLNSKHYLRCALIGLLRISVPAVLRGETAGLSFTISEHFSNLRLAMALLR